VVAILPLAALPIAMAGTGAMTLLLAVLSVTLIVPRALVEGGRFIFNNRGGSDATIEWLTRSVDLSLALPSVHRDGGTIALRDGLIWIGLLAAAGLVAGMLSKRRSASTSLGYAGIGAGLAAILAATVVWSLHGQAVITPDRSKLAAFAAYRPAWHAAPAGWLDQLTIDVARPTRVNRLPAGEYRVSRVEPWKVTVGRNDQPIEMAGDRVRFPVMLQSPTLQAYDQRLTPVAAITPALGRSATHAAQVATTRVYAFDEHVYLERDGLWTRANEDAAVVFDDANRASSGLPLTITAGAVPTTVRLRSGSFDRTLTLEAGQQESVTLPPSTDGTWALDVQSGPGFRPSERDAGSTDVRLLAAWIGLVH
jgi:hypothetical protein